MFATLRDLKRKMNRYCKPKAQVQSGGAGRSIARSRVSPVEENNSQQVALEMASFQSFPPLPQPLGKVHTATGGEVQDEDGTKNQEDELVGKAQERRDVAEVQNPLLTSIPEEAAASASGGQHDLEFQLFPPGRSNLFLNEITPPGYNNTRSGLNESMLPESLLAPDAGEDSEWRDLEKALFAHRQSYLSDEPSTSTAQSQAQANQCLEEEIHKRGPQFLMQLRSYQWEHLKKLPVASLAVGDGRPLPGTGATSAAFGVRGCCCLHDYWPEPFAKLNTLKETKEVGTQTDGKFVHVVQTNTWDFGTIGGNYEVWFFQNFDGFFDMLPFRGDHIQPSAMGSITARPPNSLASTGGFTSYQQDHLGSYYQNGPLYHIDEMNRMLEPHGYQGGSFYPGYGSDDFGQSNVQQQLYQRGLAEYSSSSPRAHNSGMSHRRMNSYRSVGRNVDKNQTVAIRNPLDSGHDFRGVDGGRQDQFPSSSSARRGEISSGPSPSKVGGEATRMKASPVKAEGIKLKWKGRLLSKDSSNPYYSEKVFVGGIDPAISLNDIAEGFQSFEVVDVAWCSKENVTGSDKHILGCAHVTLRNKEQVKKLINSCEIWRSQVKYWKGQQTLHFVLEYRGKKSLVEIILWDVHQAVFNDSSVKSLAAGETLKNIFLGNLHARISAKDIAMFFHSLEFPDVAIIRIGTDKTDYPCGYAKVSFTSHDSFIRAVCARKLILETPDFTRVLQIEPFMDSTTCSACCQYSASIYCRNDACHWFYCNGCYEIFHRSINSDPHPHSKDAVRRPKFRKEMKGNVFSA